MKNVKHQNFENLKTYISYNNLFELIEVMEHGCFQGKHKFHNFDKFIYMCYNCYNYHNLLITSASTNAQYSRTFLTEGIKFWWLRLATIGYLRSGLYWRCHVRMGPRYYRTFSREQFTTKLQARTKQPQWWRWTLESGTGCWIFSPRTFPIIMIRVYFKYEFAATSSSLSCTGSQISHRGSVKVLPIWHTHSWSEAAGWVGFLVNPVTSAP